MKKLHPLILLVLIMLLLLSGLEPLFAETSDDIYGLQIGEIEISGNMRTRDRTILRIGRVETGEILAPGTMCGPAKYRSGSASRCPSGNLMRRSPT
ncbi:MAG: hypothetical protein SVR04_01160 [Spirochaetota bacterium]|nr:hypothetical protein [Spirochaetota bacterium]